MLCYGHEVLALSQILYQFLLVLTRVFFYYKFLDESLLKKRT